MPSTGESVLPNDFRETFASPAITFARASLTDQLLHQLPSLGQGDLGLQSGSRGGARDR